MSLTIFNRSGVVTTGGFDIHEDPLSFLRIIIGLSYVCSQDHGFDPTVLLMGKQGCMMVGRDRYMIQDVLYVEGVIRGEEQYATKFV